MIEQQNTPTDPIESTWPTLKREHLDLAAAHVYDLVAPPGALPWADLSDGQQADYRRRVWQACQATDVQAERVRAAAPKLLAALKEMDALVESLWDSIPWGNTFNLDVERLNRAPVEAKKAIAEAEGVQ